MDANQLHGTWKLCAFELRSGTGELSFPFGKQASGQLIYALDGYMSVVLMAEGRTPFRSPDIQLASTEERALAAATYLSYSGKYELRGDRVLHHVSSSLFPNWIGQTQERIVEFDGRRLSLSTPPMRVDGQEQRAYLVWERAHGV